jgi:hypothetical protein
MGLNQSQDQDGKFYNNPRNDGIYWKNSMTSLHGIKVNQVITPLVNMQLTHMGFHLVK